MVRGSGKFKTKRGGGRNFSRNLEPVEADYERATPNKWSARGEEEDSDDSDEEDSEEESSDDDGTGVTPQPGPLASGSAAQELTRTERRAQKKAGKPAKPAAKAGAIADGVEEESEEEEDDSALVNPNRTSQKSTKLANVGTAPVELSRREREEKEKKEAKERYWKLHQAGKTDQAKADLARLAAIRKEREQAAAQRKAEQAAKDAELASKAAASRQKR